MKLFYTLILTILFSTLQAQSTFVVSGKVTDEKGNAIPGASLYFKSLKKGAVTDFEGNYKFPSLPKGTHEIQVDFLSFKTVNKTITIDKNIIENFILPEGGYMLEGIIVTAQKREQKNKEVPIAITSYGGKFIEAQGTFEYDGFSEYVPGLQVQVQSVNNPGVVIRGITSDSGDSRVEPRVSIFQDGVSISKSRGSVVELYDIERVEVLKGPQGTLFGRGAQIGAMHIIQNKAKNNTSGKIKVGYGNFQQLLATGHFNAAVSDDFYVRVAGIYNKRDGYIENLSGGTLNGKETFAFRTSFKYNFSENTTLDVIANWQKDTPPGTGFKSGSFAPKGGDKDPNTFADLERGEELGVDRTVYGVTGILNHSFSDNFDLTSTTAYREFDSTEAFDSDGTVAPALFFKEISIGKQFSQELRFNFNNDNGLKGFFGTNFFHEDGSQEVPFEVNEQSFAALLLDQLSPKNAPKIFFNKSGPTIMPNLPNIPKLGPLAGAPLSNYGKETFINYGKNSAVDIFADASYDVTEKLTFTLGVRGTWENIEAGYEVIDQEVPKVLGFATKNSPNVLFAPTNGKITKNEKFLSAVGRFAMDYDLSDNLTVFGNVSRGRRPNVINIDHEKTTVLSDEIVWSYEIGSKSLFLNKRLMFDFSAFMYDYSNFQTNVTELVDTTLVNITKDSGNASAVGLETAVQYAFSKNTSIFANYGYIDASFNDTDSDGNKQELAGNTFRLTPKHSMSFGLNLGIDATKNLNIYFRPTYTYKSKVFFEETNLPGISQDGYGLLNCRVGLIANKKYELNFFMNNAMDKKFIIDAGNTGQSFGIPTFIAGAPRFLGAQVSVKF